MPERKWALALLFFATCDLVVSFGVAFVAFAFAHRSGGVSLCYMGIQGISHLSSSLVLMFRFVPELLPSKGREQDSTNEDALMLKQRRRDLRREQVFAVSMGMAMLVSCVALLFKAIRKLSHWDRWHSDHSHFDELIQEVSAILAWLGLGCYSVQALMRGACARRVRISIVRRSCSISVVSLFFFLLHGLSVSFQREWSWKAEPIAAIVLAALMLIDGIHMLIENLGDVDARLAKNARV